MNTLQPIRVTAHLEAGVAWAGTWGIALDGLLAAQVHAEHKTQLHSTGQPHTPVLEQPDPADLKLPLARCTRSDEWHWAATCAWPVDGHDLLPDVRWWSARVDHQHLETLTSELPTNLREREGRYRARWMPLLATICTAVTWHAVGDLNQVAKLLDPIGAIGKKRAAGQGRVLRWSVTTADQMDEWSAAHLHPDGSLGRPTPPGCLDGRPDVHDGGTGAAGLRPPYLHPARQRHLHLPAQTLP
jgi:hypothetical protein